jgi:hypothetical protein
MIRVYSGYTSDVLRLLLVCADILSIEPCGGLHLLVFIESVLPLAIRYNVNQ